MLNLDLDTPPHEIFVIIKYSVNVVKIKFYKRVRISRKCNEIKHRINERTCSYFGTERLEKGLYGRIITEVDVIGKISKI